MWTLSESVKLSATPMISRLPMTAAFVAVAASRPMIRPMQVTIAAGEPKLTDRRSIKSVIARRADRIGRSKVASTALMSGSPVGLDETLFALLDVRLEEPQLLVEGPREGGQQISGVG